MNAPHQANEQGSPGADEAARAAEAASYRAMDTRELLARVVEELKRDDLAGKRVKLDLSALQAAQIVGQLQLALGHPRNTQSGARVARALAAQIQEAFCQTPALREICRRGWHREYDGSPPQSPPEGGEGET